MNEITALKKDIKWLNATIYMLCIVIFIYTYNTSPYFKEFKDINFKIIKELINDPAGDVEGIVIENLDWRTIG